VAVSRLCLDTSAYSHFKRHHDPIVALISTASWIGLPAIALGELRIGFLLGKHADANERELRKLLAHPLVEVLDVDAEAARIYAEIIVALRRAGTPVPTNDAWIAALAAREGAMVVTYDAHFARIERVSARILSR
jgi:predicted nucleic acid-binding protein